MMPALDELGADESVSGVYIFDGGISYTSSIWNRVFGTSEGVREVGGKSKRGVGGMGRDLNNECTFPIPPPVTELVKTIGTTFETSFDNVVMTRATSSSSDRLTCCKLNPCSPCSLELDSINGFRPAAFSAESTFVKLCLSPVFDARSNLVITTTRGSINLMHRPKWANDRSKPA